jgi:hypothetical protein
MAWQLVGSVLTDHPALPERQFRVLLCLAHAAPIQTRRAAPGLAAITHQANCAERTARRALGALAQRGLIKPVGGHGPGHAQLYELIIEPVWINGGHAADPNSGHPGDRSTAATQATAVDPDTGHHEWPVFDESNSGQPGPDSGQPGPEQRPPMSGRATDPDRTDPPARAPEPDAEPVWLRGPRPSPPPRRRPAPAAAPTPQPPAWRRTGPAPADSVALTGAQLAREAMADRPGYTYEPPALPRTEDDRRAVARQQARQAAAARRDQDGQPGLAGTPGPGAALPSGPQRRPPGPAPEAEPYPPEPPEEDQW